MNFDTLLFEVDSPRCDRKRFTRRECSCKKILMTSFTNTLETQMEIEGREIAACAGTPDGREGIAAFVDKRAPNFS